MKIQKEIFSNLLQESIKVQKNDFTRTRKQSFSTTFLFMINFLNKSLSIEIDDFVGYLKMECSLSSFKSFTKNTFVQYRRKIKPEVFKKLSSILIDEFYTDNDDAIKQRMVLGCYQ